MLSQKGPRLPMSQIITALFFIIIIIRRRRCIFLSHPPFFHFFVNSSLSVCVLWDSDHRSQHARLGVRYQQNGFTITSMTALLTTSWYFLIFNSLPKMRFKFVGAENHSRLHCTTHGTSILKSSAMLRMSSSCWKIVLDDHPLVIDERTCKDPISAEYDGHCAFPWVLFLFPVEYLSSCQSFFCVDPHACCELGSYRTFFHPPTLGSYPSWSWRWRKLLFIERQLVC